MINVSNRSNALPLGKQRGKHNGWVANLRKLYKTQKSCKWITTTTTEVNQGGSKTKEKRKILGDN